MKDSENPNLWWCSYCNRYHKNIESFNQCEEGHMCCSEYNCDLIKGVEEFNIKKQDCPGCIRKNINDIDPIKYRGNCPMCDSSNVDSESEDNERIKCCDDCDFQWIEQYEIVTIYVPGIEESFEIKSEKE